MDESVAPSSSQGGLTKINLFGNFGISKQQQRSSFLIPEKISEKSSETSETGKKESNFAI
jgi:hypothetical protein